MVVSLTENLRFRLESSLKDEWTRVCDSRKISQQDAVNALISWFVKQEELVQLMIFGQVTQREDLIRTILRRAGDSGSKQVPIELNEAVEAARIALDRLEQIAIAQRVALTDQNSKRKKG